MSGKSPILIANELCKNYQEQPLLRRISFSLEQGEILCLLGPSGSGKTTLLRLLAGLEKPDGGSLHYGGRDLCNVAPHRRNFGMMFQDYALFPHKKVGENIAFGLEMQGCSKSEKTRRVDEMLELVGLGNFGERNIDELSGGERQRVALARSLAPRPPLLLLDEPLGSLDRALRDRLTGEIRTILKKLAVTAVFVTHDQGEAFSVADKIAILHRGMLQQIDRPEKLYRRPANRDVASFLGFVNLVPCQIDAENHCHSPLGCLRLDPPLLPVREGRAILLLRPEGARLAFGKEPENPAVLSLTGVVTSRLYQGSSYKVSLSSVGQELSFDLPINPPPPELGLPIRLRLDREALVLLP